MTAPALRIRNLGVAFGSGRHRSEVLHDVSLHVAAGESLAVVGESGAGKSVLMRAILGVHPAGREPEVSGSVEIDGVDALRLRPRARRRMLGRSVAFIHQDPLLSLNPAVRVEEQMTEALRNHAIITSSARRRASAVEMMRRIMFREPESALSRFPHQLSGGQRQRVSIGAALIARPALLIADEPTTALDVTVQKQVLDMLDELRSELGTALVLVTHDLAVAAERCDRIAVLRHGRIVEEGPTADIIAAPQHPYTAALLACTLTLDGPRRRRIMIPHESGAAQ